MTTPDRGTRPDVVVVGAINVDLVVAAPRLPGPGETVVGGGLERHGGGKGANAAVAAARAGATVHLVGAVGADETGAGALEELRAEGIDVGSVAVLDGEATGVALIVVDPSGENQIAVGAGANAALAVDHVLQALPGLLRAAGCVLISTEIPGKVVALAVAMTIDAGVPCILNPAPVLAEVLDVLPKGPILTPNATELRDLVEALEPARGNELASCTAAGLAAELVARSGAVVIVTMGRDGAQVARPDGHQYHVPAPQATARDTTGAGDTFNGVLATRLAGGEPIEVAVRAAVAAASLSVAQVGARAGMPNAAAIAAAVLHM